MSTASRNDVMAAILALIQNMTFDPALNGINAWVTVSNRLKLWGDVGSELQPAAYLVTHRETDEYRGLGLLRRRLELQVWIYLRTDTCPGQPQLDTLMEAFETAFNTPDNFSDNTNTLGGLVYWVRIEGKVFKDPGDLDNQALMIVPLVVEMP